MEKRKLKALQLMQEIGGSFAAALATAWVCADSTNDEKLTNAFGGLLETYAETAERLEKMGVV